LHARLKGLQLEKMSSSELKELAKKVGVDLKSKRSHVKSTGKARLVDEIHNFVIGKFLLAASTLS
jgi:hypothetical protein